MTIDATLPHQVLSGIIRMLPEWEDHEMQTAAVLMERVRLHHWGDTPTRRVAETMMTHLGQPRSFGFTTLKHELPDCSATLDRIRAADPVENIALAVEQVTEQGMQADIAAAWVQAEKDRTEGMPAATVASRLAEALQHATSQGESYRHISEIESVVDHVESMLERPSAILRLGELDRYLRWGGLPMSDRDGQTVLIVGVSGHGKTALGIDMALRSAYQGHLTDYNILADASEYEVRERMVHRVAGLSLDDSMNLDAEVPPRRPRPREKVRDRLRWAESVLNGLPLNINADTPDMNQHELRIHLAAKRARGVRLSVIENLDHMQWDQREERLDRRFQLGRLTQICRQSDRQTGHHTILLAQANRDALVSGDGIPRGHHVADSDQPRRHCTIVVGIKNPNMDNDDRDSPARQDLLGYVSKNRSGRTGPLTFPVAMINPRAMSNVGVEHV